MRTIRQMQLRVVPKASAILWLFDLDKRPEALGNRKKISVRLKAKTTTVKS